MEIFMARAGGNEGGSSGKTGSGGGGKDVLYFPEEIGQGDNTLKTNPGGFPSIQHYCRIKAYPTNIQEMSEALNSAIDKVQKDGLKGAGQLAGDIAGAVAKGVYSSSSDKEDGVVYLPIPKDLKIPDTVVNFKDMEPTKTLLAATIAESGLNALTDPGSGGSFDAFKKNLAKNFSSDDAITLTGLGIAGIIDKLAGTDTKGVASKLAGRAINPMATQVFEGVSLREFTLNWELVPKSPSEAKQIESIIRFFSIKSRPSAGGDARYILKFPHEFTVEFGLGKRSEDGNTNKYLFKTKKCVLKNVSIDPTVIGQFSAFGKSTGYHGMPFKHGLSLSFQETQIVTAEDMEEYYGG
jgi:hypothetical protein